MKKLQLSLFLLVFSLSCYSQLSKNQLYGEWKVEKILKKPSSSEFELLIEGFSKSVFEFQNDGDFKLSTSSDSQIFMMITEMTKNTKWKFDASQQLIRIGNAEDNYSIMGIYPKEENSKIVFFIDESGITLEMKKLK